MYPCSFLNIRLVDELMRWRENCVYKVSFFLMTRRCKRSHPYSDTKVKAGCRVACTRLKTALCHTGQHNLLNVRDSDGYLRFTPFVQGQCQHITNASFPFFSRMKIFHHIFLFLTYSAAPLDKGPRTLIRFSISRRCDATWQSSDQLTFVGSIVWGGVCCTLWC